MRRVAEFHGEPVNDDEIGYLADCLPIVEVHHVSMGIRRHACHLNSFVRPEMTDAVVIPYTETNAKGKGTYF